jgi:ribosomal protein L44E
MQHYTRSTVSAAAWCPKCKRHTQHRVDDRRKGPCLECIGRLEQQHQTSRAPAAQQQPLFKESA